MANRPLPARATDSYEANRRSFLKHSSLVAAGLTAAGTLSISQSAHAAGSDILKVGLVGCGGRGTGAAAQALTGDKNAQLVALGDAFADRLQGSLKNLATDPDFSSRVDVPTERQFVGFDAYKQVIDSGVDVVLLCGPPGFRPAHFQYAVEKGKHIFAEKPVAVDAPGVRSIMENAAIAKQKGLAVVSGLCYRYHLGKREIVKRVHDGEIGDVINLHVSYNGGTSWHHGKKPEWSEMEYQVRNWPYYNWLSGDFNVEQHVHSLDKAAWVMKDETPLRASGMGGRQVRTGEQFGNVYDHMAVAYEYADGKKVFANCRQMAGCSHDVSDYIYGAKGVAEMMSETITPYGGKKWKNREKSPNMWQQEQTELFASIRSGTPLFNADYMCKSTMMAIMGRMACYTGKTLTWEDCINSQQKLGPEKLEWGDVPVVPVAMPGITPFV